MNLLNIFKLSNVKKEIPMSEIKFAPFENDDFYVPIKANDEAVGFDCKARSIDFKDDGSVVIKLGFQCEFPKNVAMLLLPRSSLAKHGWVLANSIGLGDPDYRGEYMAVFRPLFDYKLTNSDFRDNTSLNLLNIADLKCIFKPKSFPYSENDRVCQIVFTADLSNKLKVNVVNKESLSFTERGSGGFGSTGD